MGNEHKQHNEQARSHIFKRSGNLQTQIYRPQPVY